MNAALRRLLRCTLAALCAAALDAAEGIDLGAATLWMQADGRSAEHRVGSGPLQRIDGGLAVDLRGVRRLQSAVLAVPVAPGTLQPDGLHLLRLRAGGGEHLVLMMPERDWSTPAAEGKANTSWHRIDGGAIASEFIHHPGANQDRVGAWFGPEQAGRRIELRDLEVRPLP